MTARIIDRGRGSEISGSRITVFRIMDCLRAGDAPETIAEQLELSLEQVQAATDYIAANREAVDAEYARILRRVGQKNPAWVEAVLARSPDELRQSIATRRMSTAPREPRGS